MADNVSVSVFKGFLSKNFIYIAFRAYKICSERYIDEKIQFLIDAFTEKDQESKISEKIKSYLNELQNPPVNNKDTNEDIVKQSNFYGYPLLDPN